jgi:hypothetical protein
MRQQELNIGLRRAWLQTALVGSALGFLLWLKYRGPQSIRDITGYLMLVCAVSVTSYFCLRSIIARRQHSPPEGKFVVLARAKSRVLFFAGSIGVGLAFVLNAIVLLRLIANPTQLADKGSTFNFWLGISTCSFALGLLYAWLGGYQVRITASLLENWSLFGGYQSIHLAEIESARIRDGWYRNRPPHRLEIFARQPSNGYELIIINLKVFGSADTDRIFRWLGSKLENRMSAQ